MVLINTVTVESINTALIALQRGENIVVGGEKGQTINNITVTNNGGEGTSIDVTPQLNALQKRVETVEKAEEELKKENDKQNIKIAELEQLGIESVEFDETTRVLFINMLNGDTFETPIPSETLSLSLENNTLKIIQGETETSVELPYIPASEKGAAGGVATLDSSGRLPYSQLPESAMEFKGTWNASTNDPHLEDGTGTNGDFYVCTMPGTTTFGPGNTVSFVQNDRVIYDGATSKWVKLLAGQVSSVNNLSGDVVLNGTNVNYDATSGSPTLKNKIDSVDTKADTQVDWNESNSSSLAYIKNKPTIPAAQVQSDWTQTDSTQKDFIKHKIPIWISTTAAQDNMSPIDSVVDGNMRPVTSNAVADIMSNLPTDAVLHYSFDEVPDYPDGSADVRILDGQTYQLQYGNYAFNPKDSNATSSNDNGTLVCNINNSTFYLGSSYYNKIFKCKIQVTAISGTLAIHNGYQNIIKRITEVGTYELTILNTNSQTYKNIYFYCSGSGYSCTFKVLKVYCGNGSYATPIIDNANGQNNATNNGGIAVQGVSGKGAYFPSANQYVNIPIANLPKPTSSRDFSISVWLKIENDYLSEETDSLKPICTIGSFAGAFGLFRSISLIGFINRDSTYTRAIVTPMKKDGNWHLYTGIYDGTTHTSKLYEDGVLIGTSGANIADYTFGGSSTIWKVWSNVVITGNSATTDKQPATIDDLLIFDRALSETEVRALYLNKANTPKYYSWADWKLSQA